MSTGAVLVADSIPSLIVKPLGSILPFYIKWAIVRYYFFQFFVKNIIINCSFHSIRVFLVCFLQICGFLLVAFADTQWMALLGIILTSMSSGLGESSLLSYSSRYHKQVTTPIQHLCSKYISFSIFSSNRNIISSWSSGVGASGLIGSFSYAILTELGFSPVNTILIMLCVPIINGAAFWILLRNPSTIPKKNSGFDCKLQAIDQENGSTKIKVKMSLSEKLNYAPSLMKYMLPMGLVYFLEYLINQALVRFYYIFCNEKYSNFYCLNFFDFSLNWLISVEFG